MADRTATLVVKVLADSKQAVGELTGASRTTSKLGKGLRAAAIPAAAAGAALLAFGKSALDSASRTQQAMGAVDSVFEGSAGTIKKWAGNAADSVGLAKSEYGELASVLGAQLKNMGLPMDQVVNKTGDLIKMGADLSATYGGTTAQAVEALSSALKGETDPIEKYGISIKQADIAAQRAAAGTDKLTGKAGKAAQAQALLKLATDQAAPALNQFAEESDTAAVAQQKATAQWENAKSALGQGLLPVATKFAGILSTVAQWIGKNTTVALVIVGVIGSLSAAVLVLNVAMTVYTAITTLAASATLMAWVAAAWPILAVVAAVALVVVAIVILWKKSTVFRGVVLGVWNAIKVAAGAVANFVKAAWRLAFTAATIYVKTYLAIVKAVWNAIRASASAVVGFLKSAWRSVWAVIGPGAKAMGAVVKAVWTGIKTAASSVVSHIKSAWSGVWSTLKSAARSAGSALSAPFDAVKSAVQAVITAVGNLISALSRIHVPKISIPHIGKAGKAAAAPAVAPGVAATSLGARATTSGGGVTINVTGAMDPEAVARQIQRLLDGHSRRVGLRTA